mmetsp:Transcript_46505/g.124308  ORF Transcript_46505/g.124308 Transcript_46505/m.124308 type:complete len:203 (-) Transcript_46505:717-1325(-)
MPCAFLLCLEGPSASPSTPAGAALGGLGLLMSEGLLPRRSVDAPRDVAEAAIFPRLLLPSTFFVCLEDLCGSCSAAAAVPAGGLELLKAALPRRSLEVPRNAAEAAASLAGPAVRVPRPFGADSGVFHELCRCASAARAGAGDLARSPVGVGGDPHSTWPAYVASWSSEETSSSLALSSCSAFSVSCQARRPWLHSSTVSSC